MQDTTPIQIISPREVCQILGVSRTTLWRVERDDDTFPRRRRLTANRVGYLSSEINEWLAALPAVDAA